MSSWDSVVHATAALAPPTSSFSHYAGGKDGSPSLRRSSRLASAGRRASSLKKETIRGLKNGFKLAKSLARRSSRSPRKQNPARNRGLGEAKAKELFDALRQRIEEITVDSEMPSDRDADGRSKLIHIINTHLRSLEELRGSFDAGINALESSKDARWSVQVKTEAADLVRAKLKELMVIFDKQFWLDQEFDAVRSEDAREKARRNRRHWAQPAESTYDQLENETRRAAHEEKRDPSASAPPLPPGITPRTPAREAARGKRRENSDYAQLDLDALA